MKHAVAACALGVLVCFPSAVLGQDEEWNRYTLEGLDGVFVRIEADAACQASGVAAAAYEADTSLKLMEGDVGVLTQAEMLAHPALPELRVSLECAEGPSGTLAYAVSLRVQQATQMLRNTQITLPESVTWYTTSLGVAGAGSAADDVGSALSGALDVFVKAWAAVNAEEEGAPAPTPGR